jgi:predicted nucleic acid-binding Zn ribbon protein
MNVTASKKDKKSVSHLGSLLDQILSQFGLSYKLGGWRVVMNWPNIVGDKIASVSRALRYENDTLLVSVPDSVWRQQLSLEVDIILEKIHALPGGKAVKRIHFVS